MLELPIDAVMPRVVETLRDHANVVVVAAPGAGKTTRVPVGLMRGNAVEGAIVMLQPRRVAARAAAERMAEENGWRVGEEVGYHIRFEKRYGPRTRIRVLTEAILTRMLMDDPYLEGVGCVILDEFHERSIHTDLALAFLREVQAAVRPELKIVVMSATLDGAVVAEFLTGAASEGKAGAPVIETPGRLFPVEIAQRPWSRDLPLEAHVARVVDEATEHDGDVLVFLPGMAEIERARRAIGERGGVAVLPLHGSLTADEQARALQPDALGRRKVILSTNIAETSLTIDGVRAVVDTGLARVASFDAQRGLDRLDLRAISKASATQRAGRAGRQGPGRVFRLWSPAEERGMEEFNVPEVRRIDLAGTILAVHGWGAKEARNFGWFEKPPEERLEAAQALLEMLGALKDGALTAAGRAMLRVPAHPRLARMLMGAAGTHLQREAAALAAVLADEGRGIKGDVAAAVDRLPQPLERVRDQFLSAMRGMDAAQGSGHAAAGQRGEAAHTLEELVLLAYPDRVARRRGADAHGAVMVGGGGLRLAPEALTPALVRSDLFVAVDVQRDGRNKKAEGTVRAAVPISEESLARLLGVREEPGLEFDAAKGKVVAIRRRFYRDLVLAEDPHGAIDNEAAGRVLGEALVAAGSARDWFEKDEPASRLMARVALARAHVPEQAWPAWDEAALVEILRAACAGRRSVEALRQPGVLVDALGESLGWQLARKIDELAPESLEVPSGSRIGLAYEAQAGGVQVILAVRLQELFGWRGTPRVCAGRVPVLLHLLSPGFKPMQVTSDLASFWRSAYFEVRKDLRVRYPKHKWPEDPLTATAEAKGRPRKS